jgi:hypothetical protein
MKDSMKAPPKKKRKSSEAKTHHQAAKPVPTKLKKSATALSFRLAATTGKQDPLIMKGVSFLAEDGACGKKLAEHFGGGVGKIEKSLCSADGKLCLFGNVVRASELPKKGNANVVACDGQQWEDLVAGDAKIDLQVVVPAMESSSVKLKRRQTLSAQKLGRPKKHSCASRKEGPHPWDMQREQGGLSCCSSMFLNRRSLRLQLTLEPARRL